MAAFVVPIHQMMMIGVCCFILLFAMPIMVSSSSSSTVLQGPGVKYISQLLEIQDREKAPPSVQISAAKALLHSVPVGKLVVLDLYAEVKPVWATSQQFYGVPYIWCMLHNFAGNIEMYGVVDSVGSGPIDARLSANSTMVGVGMSMEGIEQNPIVYELMSEMAFRQDKVDLKAWIHLYVQRRYGSLVPSIQDAWNILYQTVYNCTDGLNVV